MICCAGQVINMKNKNTDEDIKDIDAQDLDAPKVNYGKSDSDRSGQDTEEFVELGEDGEELSIKDVTKKLREKIKKLEIEKQDYLNSWQRALADYKNREMQIEKEKKEWGGYAVKRFAEELLIVMDTYDAAKSNKAAWDSVDQNWRVGIEYIFMTFESKLSEQGFEKFGKVGDVYNPELHEALGVETKTSDTKTPDTKTPSDQSTKTPPSPLLNQEGGEAQIAQIIMSGYNYKGQLFRAAKVKVWG